MNSIRQRIFDLIQPAAGDDILSRIFDATITLLILSSVACVFAVTFDLSKECVARMNQFEVFASVVFSIEYALRIATADLLYPQYGKTRAVIAYITSGSAIIDLLSILPLYLPMFLPESLLAVRIFRLLRLFRVFKLNRYFESVSAIGEVVRAKSRELIGSLFFVSLMLVISSLVIYTVEHDAQPDAFKNAFTGMWWAVATLTTVGYGDIYPVTVLGRVFGAIIALLGIGMVAIPTGIISSGLVEHMSRKKDRDSEGELDCELDCDYNLVVGYDFQAKSLIKRLLTTSDLRVLLITDRDVRAVRSEMATELTVKESKRLMYMRRDLALADAYAGLRIRGAKTIYLLGDETMPGRDGIVLRASEMIAIKASSEKRLESDVPVKAYLQLEDPGVYSQMRSQELSMDRRDPDGKPLFDLEVFNYYDSWVWKCWSEKDSADGDDSYLPLRFKSDAEFVELFVIGSGKARKALVDSAITLMNYGDNQKRCRLSVVGDDSTTLLPPEDAIAEFPELEVADYSARDLSRKVMSRMIEAASDCKGAVTIAIVEDDPERAVRMYLGLPFALRNKEISVLVWMGSQSRNLPEKTLLKVVDDRTNLRYFGMTDSLPWLERDRSATGADVNFFYSVHDQLPKGTDISLPETARGIWSGETAVAAWSANKRWKKWSSINSSGSYKEKAAMIAGRALTPELQLRLLKAEHNRWWAERLLSDWRVGKRDDSHRIHPNLVPFEQLDDFTKDIDKICIAAMARQGFIA